ncbi:MAG: para-aminobenzoate synthase, (PABA) [Thelocarpon superellum]|nr:MAG: para-aminobenzoate synthase, (PABA) [Thelocarpon superellum]
MGPNVLPQQEPSRPHRDERRRILFVDAYDSFSNNIVALLESRLHAAVQVIRIDCETAEEGWDSFLDSFHAIVLGPGPGNPTTAGDVGLMVKVWKMHDDHLLPVLGICLGFQSLACAFGATVKRLTSPTHGLPCQVLHDGYSIFHGVDEVSPIRYHSLHVDMQHPIQARGSVDYPRQLWDPSEACPDLRPLAWDLDDLVNGALLMAVKHRTKPFWGLQYHPESILTNAASLGVLDNWWAEVARWWADPRKTSPRETGLRDTAPEHRAADVLPTPSSPRSLPSTDPSSQKGARLVLTTSVFGRDDPVAQLHEALCGGGAEVIMLDTAVTQEGTGRYSILGCVQRGRTVKIQYAAGASSVKVWTDQHYGPSLRRVDLRSFPGGFWQYLNVYMAERKAVGGDPGSPFWGGLMGYIPYEVGLPCTGVAPHPPDRAKIAPGEHPDAVFAFVERSVVVDHYEKAIYIQSLLPDDHTWMYQTRATVEEGRRKLPVKLTLGESCILDGYLGAATVTRPDEQAYGDKIRKCKELIAAGESYEICLTAQTTIAVSRSGYGDVSWPLYKRLRQRNPAPFGAYVRLGPATILSSSPERFLRWDRAGRCQMRPIKGTVQKTPGIDQALATEMLAEPKERAENLMIVDLIRHDLHGVLGTGEVDVTQLMKVESYRTVWQLVSVVEGQMPPVKPSSGSPAVTGIDVLAACLAPGSMTGAPKKRSCEILQTLEDGPRGIYSGVLGYICAGGGGDFCVVIRTAFKWDPPRPRGRRQSWDGASRRGGDEEDDWLGDPEYTSPLDVWRIGAGGAITALSNVGDEVAEMQGKLRSTLAAFEADPCQTSVRAGGGIACLGDPSSNTVRVPSGALPRQPDVIWRMYQEGGGFRAGGGFLLADEFIEAIASCSSWPQVVDTVHATEDLVIERGHRRSGQIRVDRSFRAMAETVPSSTPPDVLDGQRGAVV